MSALDTFRWYADEIMKKPSTELQRLIAERRQYFFMLRSEDERQRFVEGFIAEMKQRLVSKKQ